jgi:hypothetical protein
VRAVRALRAQATCRVPCRSAGAVLSVSARGDEAEAWEGAQARRAASAHHPAAPGEAMTARAPDGAYGRGPARRIAGVR